MKKLLGIFIIQGENQISSDVQSIGNDLLDISNDLKGFDFNTLRGIVNTLPSSISGVAKFKKALKDIQEEIEDLQGRTAKPADSFQAAGGLLAGNLTVEEVIGKSRKLRDAYNKILPYTDLKFAIQQGFKKDIENINRFLRDAIPFEELAVILNSIKSVAVTIVEIINFILALITTINQIIKNSTYSS